LNYDVSLENELFRVLIHGVLHLVGYDDYDEWQRKRMRLRENFWIKEIKK
jgi:rRNA maturation RNase YbeY